MPLMTPDPTFYPSPTMATQSPPETVRVSRADQPADDGGADAIGVVDLDPDSNGYGRLVGQTDMPTRRRRAASLRLERLQLLPLPLRAASAHGAALSGRAGHQFLAHSHSRHEAQSAAATDREGDRAGDVGAAHRLRRAAHRALRTGRHLHERARRARRQRPRRHVHPGSGNVRHSRTMGDRPRTAGARVRHLVAPGAGHDGHQHVGHAEHGEGRRQPRAPARREVRKHDCTCGTCAAGATCRN